MTKQGDAAAADVNNIVHRFIAHGELPRNFGQPHYGDFSTVGDYLSASLKVKQAQEQFDALPASVRAHANNNPAEFLDMVYDPDRREELVELGLIEEQMPAALVEEPNQPADPIEPSAPAEPTPSGG